MGGALKSLTNFANPEVAGTGMKAADLTSRGYSMGDLSTLGLKQSPLQKVAAGAKSALLGGLNKSEGAEPGSPVLPGPEGGPQVDPGYFRPMSGIYGY